VKGHFVLYAVVVRKDGVEVATDDASAPSVVNDMLVVYLRDTVMANLAKQPAAPSDGTQDTGATAAATT
jgi:hypothetical protein